MVKTEAQKKAQKKYFQKYYQANKDKYEGEDGYTRSQNIEYVACDICNTLIRSKTLTRHQATKKHQKAMIATTSDDSSSDIIKVKIQYIKDFAKTILPNVNISLD